MEYDVAQISLEMGVEPRYVEKTLRISDLLLRMSEVRFLKEKLSLYGGTALNFIHLKSISRLSIDLDFNYRHSGKKEWYEERDEIDTHLKRVLNDMGYADISIQASYPLTRMDVHYTDLMKAHDSFKIEIGYMRRMPVMRGDIYGNFLHVGTKERFGVLTPQREELFSNKLATLLSRSSGRDVFDAYMIARSDFDRGTLRECLVIESLMDGLNLHETDIEGAVKKAAIDSYLKNLLRAKPPADIYEAVKTFLSGLVKELKPCEMEVLEDFFRTGRLETENMDPKGVLNPLLNSHPLIQRQRQKLSKER